MTSGSRCKSVSGVGASTVLVNLWFQRFVSHHQRLLGEERSLEKVLQRWLRERPHAGAREGSCVRAHAGIRAVPRKTQLTDGFICENL